MIEAGMLSMLDAFREISASAYSSGIPAETAPAAARPEPPARRECLAKEPRCTPSEAGRRPRAHRAQTSHLPRIPLRVAATTANCISKP